MLGRSNFLVQSYSQDQSPAFPVLDALTWPTQHCMTHQRRVTATNNTLLLRTATLHCVWRIKTISVRDEAGVSLMARWTFLLISVITSALWISDQTAHRLKQRNKYLQHYSFLLLLNLYQFPHCTPSDAREQKSWVAFILAHFYHCLTAIKFHTARLLQQGNRYEYLGEYISKFW